MNSVNAAKVLRTFMICWSAGLVVLFALGLLTSNSLFIKIAGISFAGLPILFSAWQLTSVQSVRNRRSQERADRWDAEHPNASEEYRQAVRELRR